MSGPRLDPLAQDALLSRLAGIVLAVWPPGAELVVIDYGRVHAGADMKVPGGVRKPWPAPAEVWEMMRDLRNGMYTDAGGTWISARLTITADRYDIKYKWPSRAT